MKKKYFTKKGWFRVLFVFCLGISVQAQTYTSWKVGSTTDKVTTTTGGVLLDGGKESNDNAFRWFLGKAGGGDVVVIRASGANGHNDYFYSQLGVTLNSVETILIDTRAKASLAEIATKIRNAEALFIAGGNQYDYISYWKDTPVEDAINYLINTKKVPVGGSSAGCAIQGKYYFTAATTSVLSADALANPYNSGVTIGVNDFISHPILNNVITDTHYDNPDRRGRQTTFLARMWKDQGAGLNAKGIGIYENAAVCIDQNGIAKIFAPATTNFAYFYQIESNSTPETVTSGSPLTWNNSGKGVKIVKIAGDPTGTTSFDLHNWITTSGSNAAWGNIKVINGTLTETLGGTPPSGNSCATPSGITTSAITNISATVSWTATAATNYTVRYKTAAASTWTTLSNTTATSVSLTGLALGTAYNVEIVGNCTSGASTSGTSTFTTTGGSTVSYCTSKGNSSSSEWIKKVVFGTINNLSNDNGGYADFTTQSTAITKGVSKTLTLTPGYSATRSLYWKVYIDYNNNGLFTDSGEEVYSIFSSATLSPSITVPTTAVTGSIRMRIIVSYNSINSPCGTYNYGETEDYTLNISSTAKMASQAGKILADSNDGVKKLPAKIEIYPNPAREDFNISFSSEVNEKVTVKVYNIQGREEKSFVIDATAGENRFRNNTAGLSNGQYVVKVIKSNEISTTKLIIVN
ncbi:GEVED domain-containing protein [Flavobacterium sp. M31R6]|uniref:GEVED domain-containing protein n=1 Tax=Flavobacterium sp. M31R6 TaxID=2739062 RepID=UPI001569B560|nr:GEVED domain-containing protein [Flavobacterium sp. M31R6]QKJ64134.1 T9SS type A sorting domain-containing protein [Flavobacterium sp. M31R6]